MHCKYMYVLSTKKLIAESCDVEYYCSQSQCRQQSVRAYTMEDHAQLSVQFRNKFTCIKSEKSFRIHIPMHNTKGAIATVMGQGLENKCEVVGQGSFTSPNACHLSTVA